MRVEERITGAWASQLAKPLAAKTISALRKMDKECMLSGDSGLNTVWEEVCIQVQCEYSPFWDTYESVIDDLLTNFVGMHEQSALLALWSITDEGRGWIYDNYNDDEGDSSAPLDISSIVAMLKENVLGTAANYTNRSIRQYHRRIEECEEW